MRRASLNILASFFILNFAYSQNLKINTNTFVKSSFESFQSGEWIKFRIHYGIFNACYATINLKDTIVNNKKVFKSKAVGRTTGLARLFFKVDDVYESIFDSKLVKPLISTRNINEGGYTKNIKIKYDYLNNQAIVNDIKHETIQYVKIEENVQDIISTFYFLRNHFDVNKLKIGDFIKITMFFDAENYDFKMKFIGYEDVKTKFGVVNCFKFEPYIQSGRVFSESGDLYLWVSNDKNKVPVKIEADLRVGSIEADIDGFKGLKHPFKIKIYE